jgi:hypothetical protein
MRRAPAVAAVIFIFFAVGLSLRSVHQNGRSCGSLLKPIDLEQNGPAGTNPRPCEGAHDIDLAIALALVATGVVGVIVSTRSRRRGDG